MANYPGVKKRAAYEAELEQLRRRIGQLSEALHDERSRKGLVKTELAKLSGKLREAEEQQQYLQHVAADAQGVVQRHRLELAKTTQALCETCAILQELLCAQDLALPRPLAEKAQKALARARDAGLAQSDPSP